MSKKSEELAKSIWENESEERIPWDNLTQDEKNILIASTRKTLREANSSYKKILNCLNEIEDGLK